MPGAPDPEYVKARRALLDVLEALGEQRSSIVLVGAQAIYVVLGEDELAVSPFTTDADILIGVSPFTTDVDVALDPRSLRSVPLLEDAMGAGGFVPVAGKVGTWSTPDGVEIDLLVPEAVGGPGRRAARIPPHGERTARKVKGLEGALVDQQAVRLTALDDADDRAFEVMCAGPAALLAAKLLKIRDRQGSANREDDKDALDVLRLLRGTGTRELAARLRQLRRSELSGEIAEEAVELLQGFFGSATAEGSLMVVRATAGIEDPEEIAAACEVLASDVLRAYLETE
jgi:hypothetical protein